MPPKRQWALSATFKRVVLRVELSENCTTALEFYITENSIWYQYLEISESAFSHAVAMPSFQTCTRIGKLPLPCDIGGAADIEALCRTLIV